MMTVGLRMMISHRPGEVVFANASRTTVSSSCVSPANTSTAASAVAALAATGNGKVLAVMLADNPTFAESAMTAASIMAQNNVWYPYVEMADDASLKGLPAQLRMNAIASHGGTTKANFEAFSLAASIVGKCHFCVKAHYDGLKKMGYTVEQLRDIGRIASVMNSVAKVLNS